MACRLNTVTTSSKDATVRLNLSYLLAYIDFVINVYKRFLLFHKNAFLTFFNFFFNVLMLYHTQSCSTIILLLVNVSDCPTSKQVKIRVTFLSCLQTFLLIFGIKRAFLTFLHFLPNVVTFVLT